MASLQTVYSFHSLHWNSILSFSEQNIKYSKRPTSVTLWATSWSLAGGLTIEHVFLILNLNLVPNQRISFTPATITNPSFKLIIRTITLLLLKSSCLIGLIIHTGANFYGYLWNPARWVNIADVPLTDLKEFPLVLQVTIHEGFDVEAVEKEGYRNVEDYFEGRSKFNMSTIGWRGHRVV